MNPGSLYNAFEGGKRGLFMESLVNSTVELAAADTAFAGLQ